MHQLLIKQRFLAYARVVIIKTGSKNLASSHLFCIKKAEAFESLTEKACNQVFLSEKKPKSSLFPRILNRWSFKIFPPFQEIYVFEICRTFSNMNQKKTSPPFILERSFDSSELQKQHYIFDVQTSFTIGAGVQED